MPIQDESSTILPNWTNYAYRQPLPTVQDMDSAGVTIRYGDCSLGLPHVHSLPLLQPHTHSVEHEQTLETFEGFCVTIHATFFGCICGLQPFLVTTHTSAKHGQANNSKRTIAFMNYLPSGLLSSCFSLRISARSSRCMQSHRHADVKEFWIGAILPLQ